ncbi:hypothetical protein AAZX31_10G095700 [Glycine max]
MPISSIPHKLSTKQRYIIHFHVTNNVIKLHHICTTHRIIPQILLSSFLLITLKSPSKHQAFPHLLFNASSSLHMVLLSPISHEGVNINYYAIHIPSFNTRLLAPKEPCPLTSSFASHTHFFHILITPPVELITRTKLHLISKLSKIDWHIVFVIASMTFCRHRDSTSCLATKVLKILPFTFPPNLLTFWLNTIIKKLSLVPTQHPPLA